MIWFKKSLPAMAPHASPAFGIVLQPYGAPPTMPMPMTDVEYANRCMTAISAPLENPLTVCNITVVLFNDTRATVASSDTHRVTLSNIAR